jgi:hypothetical protein
MFGNEVGNAGDRSHGEAKKDVATVHAGRGCQRFYRGREFLDSERAAG